MVYCILHCGNIVNIWEYQHYVRLLKCSINKLIITIIIFVINLACLFFFKQLQALLKHNNIDYTDMDEAEEDENINLGNIFQWIILANEYNIGKSITSKTI